MKTEWQNYEQLKEIPANIHRVEVILSAEKPKEDDNGFIMETAFQYVPIEGMTLWCRFWVLEE